jgi:polysaccharide export outer membrane protein
MNNFTKLEQELSKLILMHRKKSGLSREELAKLAMVGKTAIFDLEHGKMTVQLDTLLRILDVLNIEVWRVADLSRSVTVRPDGRISMPVVGDLDAIGLSLVQLKELLTQKFSDYVWNPQVSISIQTFGGRKFIILGEIRGPGVYRYQQDISLVEAIALAGGFKEFSKTGKIMIIRGDIRKQPQVKIISANMNNFFKKGMLTENLTILSNDIIYVGKDILGDYRDIIDQFIAPSLGVPTNFFVLRSAYVTAQNRRY